MKKINQSDGIHWLSNTWQNCVDPDFLCKKSQVISGLRRLSDSGIFMHSYLILEQYGGQLTGLFSLGDAVTVQSYLKLSRVFSKGNSFAKTALKSSSG